MFSQISKSHSKILANSRKIGSEFSKQLDFKDMKFTVQKKTMENLKENSISINITGYEHKRPY